ncbi:post-transcriptional regulator [Ureibacillus aquaedulcis]|uniref:Post-transcriptional regulator n=1 Tax=Ureibacillus aquaedulcis TaxID=3058421 RepID=A0ABT8GTK9_9BACL|nr:post-transcriptional regulator [Ureibacillus sp. BA0131]MDN4494564.1 post-transcriptional regulator [Ureibacillus sp. BA0131]
MIQFEQLYKEVLPVLQSKMEEINYYEYDGIKLEDIWNFCIKKKWRKKKVEDMHLYEIVETIYSVKPSEIVSFFQIQQFRTENWFGDISRDELQELLKPKNAADAK